MIKNIIKKYKNKLFLIAYSGGLDSTVLLHQLFLIQKNNIPDMKIRAIHINHNLSPFSNHWLKHCQNKCKKYKIPLIIENIQINTTKNNLEERLRIKRYQIFYKNLLNDEILLTGHHLNDQCETLFLSLKRASGPTGLASMSIESMFGKKKIIRPLLEKNRNELKNWALYHKLKWIEDESNIDIFYDRNFIRHKIIPILEKRWPYFLKNCAHTANICRQETTVLNQFLKEDIQQYLTLDQSLKIKSFKHINPIKCHLIIRYWISLYIIKIPSYKIISSIYQQMIHGRIDSNPKIIINNNEIRRYKNIIYLIKTSISVKKIILFWHNTKKYLILPNKLGYLKQNYQGLSVPAPKKNELINIRFQYEGKILIIGRNKRRKLKKIWQEKNIPPWIRNQIPLLFYNNRFISALGVFVIQTNKQEEKIWKISWQNDILLNKNSNKYLFI
ncbi:tRNA lysidine(34) synthetase TilS [Buchnera aphidicola]|uniref:tRNA lysidine(34) synthetase TilS n=1 Tax=Buchnera aphidicola TaxID=9 RepID=UPI003BEEF208